MAEAVDAACSALLVGDRRAFEAATERLAGNGGRTGWRAAAEGVLAELLHDTVGEVWRRGWEPADLLRLAGRRLDRPAATRVLRAALASELSAYAPATLDRRWHAQLDEHGLRPWWPASTTFLQAVAAAHPRGWSGTVADAIETAALADSLPWLEPVSARPGTASPEAATPEAAAASAVDDRVLARVRALLAKAESTTYPAEAETFTAAAQAIMARHSIDRAVLAAKQAVSSEEPAGRRVGVDPPYEEAKVSLLDAVCRANRCRAVWSKELGFVTAVGFPADLDAVDVLFTSLLVQATSAVAAAGSRTDAVGRSRTRSFRQSFLVSYASRIGERLGEATRDQADEASEAVGGDLLPVLAARDEAVTRAATAMFPQATARPVAGGRDREGWARGRAAADRASLANGAAVEPGRA